VQSVQQLAMVWTTEWFELSHFLFSTSRPVLGPTQPHFQWVKGALSPEVKRPGHEIDHSPPSRASIKNVGDKPPLPGLHVTVLN
jgi:hypothetical protein